MRPVSTRRRLKKQLLEWCQTSWGQLALFFLPLSCSALRRIILICFSFTFFSRRKKGMFFVNLHCINSSPVGIYYSRYSFSALQTTLIIDFWHSTAAVYYVFLSTDKSDSIKVALLHSSLFTNAWTKLYFIFYRMQSTVSGILTWEYEGCF